MVSFDDYARKTPSDSKDIPGFFYTNRHFLSDSWEIGDYTYGVPNLFHSVGGSKLYVGKFCSIAGGVRCFLGGHHDTKTVSAYPFGTLRSDYPKAPPRPTTKGDIHIGNDVWIGNNVTILSGVTIGDGAVIGLGSIATKDVPPYAIVAGNPARVRKMRFPDEVIAALLRIKWWDWPIERIREHADLIAGDDPWKLIEVAKKYE